MKATRSWRVSVLWILLVCAATGVALADCYSFGNSSAGYESGYGYICEGTGPGCTECVSPVGGSGGGYESCISNWGHDGDMWCTQWGSDYVWP